MLDGREGDYNIHGLVHLVDGQSLVDLPHRFAGFLHCFQRLLVYIGGFDGVYLLFECGDLSGGLLEGVGVLLLAAEGCFGRYNRQIQSACHSVLEPSLSRVSPVIIFLSDPRVPALMTLQPVSNLPVLFELTCFLATASCSAIWFSKCFSRFCSMSSVCRSPRIAVLGASLRFWAPPPNQPHMLGGPLCLAGDETASSFRQACSASREQ